MRKIWFIAWHDLFLMVRDKVFFFWTLVFPLIFIFIFGTLFKSGSQTSTAALTILNKDKGHWGAYFIEKIESPTIEITEVKTEPANYNRILIIPEDFSNHIETQTPQRLILKKNEGASNEASAQVETKIIQAIAKLITELIVNRDIPVRELFAQKRPFRDIITLHTHFPEGTITTKPSGFDHVIPGTIVHFIMMMVLIYGGVTVMEDRKRGILSRVLYSAVSIPMLWGSKFIARLLMGILQALILIVTGLLFFRLNIGSYGLTAVIVLAFSICMAAFSIFIGSVCKKEDIIIGISILFANIFAALGGCWWPIEIVPPLFRTAGMISPAYWAMDAFHQDIFFHKGFADILVNILVLLLWAIFFTFLAVKYFKIKE